MLKSRLLVRLAALLCLACLASLADEALLFSFFRNNGEDGLFLATSADGLRWEALNGDRPLVKPVVGESQLMRDPSITRGPDGVFRMVWTTSWRGKTIGYASSTDLRRWSTQRAIEVLPDEPGVVNCWAPEIYYDDPSGEFVIVWASTIQGRFPETQGAGSGDYNHRQYVIRTRDFNTFSKAKLFYDPGFQVIDAALFRSGGSFFMVVKNETLKPPAKYLFLTSAPALDGPWSPPGPSISGPEWAEGASPIRIGEFWHIYFDKYRQKRYGAIRSQNLRNWEDITDKVVFPEGARHGTVFRAPREVVERLRAAEQ